MLSFYASLQDLVLEAGETKSNIMQGRFVFHDAVGVVMYGMTGGDAADISIEVNFDPSADENSTGWVTLNDASGPLLAPTLGTARVYQEPCYVGSFRLSRAATGTATTFKINKIFTTGQTC